MRLLCAGRGARAHRLHALENLVPAECPPARRVAVRITLVLVHLSLLLVAPYGFLDSFIGPHHLVVLATLPILGHCPRPALGPHLRPSHLAPFFSLAAAHHPVALNPSITIPKPPMILTPLPRMPSPQDRVHPARTGSGGHWVNDIQVERTQTWRIAPLNAPSRRKSERGMGARQRDPGHEHHGDIDAEGGRTSPPIAQYRVLQLGWGSLSSARTPAQALDPCAQRAEKLPRFTLQNPDKPRSQRFRARQGERTSMAPRL